MAKTIGGKKKTSPKSDSTSGSSSKAKKTTSSSGRGTREPTTFQKFVKAKTAELKEERPNMDGGDRRAEVLRLWKIDPSNPKAQEEESE
ncbi:hypothetical protein JCM10449v2_003248 [Rhodotorula kratochvilovae]